MNNDIARDPRPPDGAIDRAIDRAVRTMMGVEPPTGLRRRVIARLEGPAPRTTLFPRLTMAAAALAAIALAVFLLKPSPPPPVQLAVTAPAPAVQAPQVAPAPPPGPAQTAVARAPRPAVTDTPIRMPRMANVFGPRDVQVAAAAVPMEDVVFPDAPTSAERGDLPGTPRPIGIAEIVVPALQVEGIRVEPLPGRR